MTKKMLNLLSFCLLIYSCGQFGAGTLGGFPEISFNESRDMVLNRINNLKSRDTSYNLPGKWKQFDDWSKRGYGFLKGHIFYFKAVPEEMYYVTFLGDSNELAKASQSRMSIRAVCQGTSKWLVYSDFTTVEKERIQKRFETEIAAKLK